MKICLVNPRGLEKPSLSLPHALLQLYAELSCFGYDIDIIDYNDPDRLLLYAHLNHYDVVGISVMSTQLSHALEIANSISPRVFVIWGGIHCLLDPVSVLKRYPKHYVVSGEGEVPIVWLIEYFLGKHTREWLAHRQGICFHDKELIINKPYFNPDLNVLNDINYYHLPGLERYINKHIYYIQQTTYILSILVSRGCHWDCSFCINTIFKKHGARYRKKSIEKVRRETEKIIDNFNIHFVIPQDEDFFQDMKFVEQWKQYAKEKQFLWGANSRYNYFSENLLNEEKIRDLSDHGLFCFGMSIEAGNENIRNKILCKQVQDRHIIKAAQTIKNSKVESLCVNTSFIVYFPGDTHDSRIRIIKWMYFLTNNINITFSGPQVYREYPGSRLYALDHGHCEGDIDHYITGLDKSGTARSLTNKYETIFYSTILIDYFNSQFRFLSYKLDTNGNPYVTVQSGDSTVGWKKRFNVMINLLMLPIQIRLKTDCWVLFFEPSVIGFIVDKVRKSRVLIKVLKTLVRK